MMKVVYRSFGVLTKRSNVVLSPDLANKSRAIRQSSLNLKEVGERRVVAGESARVCAFFKIRSATSSVKRHSNIIEETRRAIERIPFFFFFDIPVQGRLRWPSS